MAKVNVLILIHGMTLERIASTHEPAYDTLFASLKAREPLLGQRIDKVVKLEWGHELLGPHPNGLDDDEQTTRAENTIFQASSYQQVRSDPSADNHLHSTPLWDLAAHAARRLTTPIKENVLVLGFTDAIYYCSPQGEQAVRKAVYSRILSQLEDYRDAEEVRLHIIAASLGATVAFDFLYGLIAPRATAPDFVAERQGDAAALERFTFWRERAQRPTATLVLGSKTTTGAQIPLLMMRSQQVVKMLAQGQRLDPTVIGVPKSGPPKWSIFYDVDDILGFPTRRLFDAHGTIKEYEVDTGLNPLDAHGRYWTNRFVVTEVAKLIRQNL